MKCPKCGYLGFETVDRCRNCGYDFSLTSAPGATAPEWAIKTGSESQGPVQELKLLDEEPPRSSQARRPFQALDLDRLIGAPPAADLPLFPGETPDDAPLIEAPSVPRPPLAVRRSTPDAARLRSRSGQVVEPELPIERAVARPDARPASRAAGAAHAGLLRRFTAGTLDGLILLGIDAAVIYFTLRLCDLRAAQFTMLPIAPLAVFLLLLNVGYSVGFTSIGGQTIGKMALGIKVVGEANQPVDVSHATLRTLTYLISWLPLGLGLLPALVGEKRRALHDRVANTQVVQVARL